MPLDKNVNIIYLAEKYEFPGSQIDLAVRGDEVRMDDLVRACETELSGASRVAGANSMKMGFGT